VVDLLQEEYKLFDDNGFIMVKTKTNMAMNLYIIGGGFLLCCAA
jgi:hypothetical protein